MTRLLDATCETCGGKAATLGTLLREGLPVPDGFVVPFAAYHTARSRPDSLLPDAISDAISGEVAAALAWMGDPPVAVRSSATNEDTVAASAAGQYESILAVQGVDAVVGAIRDCWASASSDRVATYWNHAGETAEPEIAVLVQRLIDADVAGVMFTPARPGDPTRIEANWGLGLTVVGGTVTPDSYAVAPDEPVQRSIGRKATRVDRSHDGSGVVVHDVPEALQSAPTLDDTATMRLAALGHQVAELLGGPQDIEWARKDGAVWLLQARPVTAPLPRVAAQRAMADDLALRGTPGAHGVATGNARIVQSPSDFSQVQAGDIVICPFTDPAWTPLFTIVAGVVTETGGALSHAAIVAREYGLPAVLGVSEATTRIRDGSRVTLNGTAGTVTLH